METQIEIPHATAQILSLGEQHNKWLDLLL
jgi:hypothetical protein